MQKIVIESFTLKILFNSSFYNFIIINFIIECFDILKNINICL